MTKVLTQLAIIITVSYSIGALAQTLHGSTDSLSGGGAIIPPTCAGVIDASAGCTLPMLGVM